MQTKGKFILMSVAEFQTFLLSRNIKRKIRIIQNHHTLIPSYRNFNGLNHFEKLKSMEDSHLKRNFSEIAQNITTFPDGTIAICRSLEKDPAGIKGANTGGICIEHLGDFDLGRDQMSEAQRKTIIRINALLCHRFELTPDTNHIVYHHWYHLSSGKRDGGAVDKNHKSCPGTAFFGGNKEIDCINNFLPLVRNELAAIRQSMNIQFENRTGIVQAPVLNVRTGPGTKFPIVGKLKENDTVSIFESDGDWDRIGEKQWVSADFIVLNE